MKVAILTAVKTDLPQDLRSSLPRGDGASNNKDFVQHRGSPKRLIHRDWPETYCDPEESQMSPVHDSDDGTNQLIRELAALGVDLPASLDERTDTLIRELAAEKAAQLEGTKAVLLPLTLVLAIAVFVICFWTCEIGPAFSIGAALLTIPAIGLLVALPVGHFLGRRATRRFISRLRDTH